MFQTRTKTYGFGRLTTVAYGHRYRAVIHPEHEATLREGGTFTDEQGIAWTVTVLKNGGRRLQSGRWRSLDMTAADLAIALGDR